MPEGSAGRNLLADFRDWLKTWVGGDLNLSSLSYIQIAIGQPPTKDHLTPEQDRAALDTLFTLLDEFLAQSLVRYWPLEVPTP